MGKRPGCYPEKCYLLWKKITLVLFCFLLFHLKNGHNTYPHFSNEIMGVTGFWFNFVGAVRGEWIQTQSCFIIMSTIINNKVI